jgi:ketosteroid isomerase-like protein
MSQENVEFVAGLYEAVNRGDFEGLFALADPPPEFEFVPSGVLIPDLVDVQRGPEGFRRLVEGFLGAFDDPYLEVHELIEARDDQVFASITIRGRGKQSGAETSWDVWQVWTVRDGSIVRGQGFTDRGTALEAVGLRE